MNDLYWAVVIGFGFTVFFLFLAIEQMGVLKKAIDKLHDDLKNIENVIRRDRA